MKEAKRQQYQIFNHRIVWQAAARNLSLVDSNQRDGRHFALGAMVLTFFSFEGYLNWLGQLILPDVWKKERKVFSKSPYSGTLGKHKYLREHLDLAAMQEDDRPLSTAIMLHRVRNFLAHTKPELGERSVEYAFPEFPPNYHGFLSEVISPDNARVSKEDIRDLSNQLHFASKVKYPDVIPEAKPFCGLLGFHTTEM